MPACPLQGCGQGRPSWAGTQDEQPEVSFSEEAVNEVKRQAMSELQKAVSDAERKAHELISTERAKMERALAEARRQASEDALTVRCGVRLSLTRPVSADLSPAIVSDFSCLFK